MFTRYAFVLFYPHWLSKTIPSLYHSKQLHHFHQYLVRAFERKIVTSSKESSLKAINPAPIFTLTVHNDARTCSPRQAAKHTALSSSAAVKNDASPALL